MNAYIDLKNDRSMGMAMGPIPWSSVVLYASVHNLDADELYELNYLIRAMEAAEWEHDQKQKDQP